MADITLNSAVRANLRTMQATTELMNRTENRLSTGKKVNSALDNPTNFFTAQALERRSGNLGSLLDSVSNSVKTLEAADNGISAITDLLEQMKSTARSAQQSPSAIGTRASFTSAVTGATASNLLATGTSTATPAAVTGGAFTAMDFTASAATAGTVTTGAFGSTLTFDDPGDKLDLVVKVDGGANTTVSIDAAAVTAALGGGATTITSATDLATVINSLATGFTATANGDGTLSMASATTGSTSSMEIVSATATDAGGGDTLANTSGIGTVAASAGADAGAAKVLSFQVDIDGSGTPTTVTIDQAAVAAVGNNDNTIDDVAELQSIIDAQLGTGVTVGTDTTTGAITLTSATSGSSSSVAITNTAVTGGLTNTSGISDTTASGTGTPPMAITSGQTLSVQVGDDATTAKTITFGTGANQVDTLDELNAQLADVGAKASLDADGKLKIETTNDHEADKLVLGGTMVDTASTTSTTAIFDFSDTASATSSAVTDTDQTKRSNYKNDYNDLRDQIGKLAKDASYNGINLLAGDDLKVVFNEDGSSKLDISGVDVMDTLGLSDLVDGDFLDSSSIDAVISKIDDAMSNLDGLSSKFGSQLSVVQTRQDFTKDMIGTLDDGANLLTAADTNEEAANLATLQTRQSLIVSSLSISTQQEQNILQLLR